jgi:hypothetical protein
MSPFVLERVHWQFPWLEKLSCKILICMSFATVSHAMNESISTLYDVRRRQQTIANANFMHKMTRRPKGSICLVMLAYVLLGPKILVFSTHRCPFCTVIAYCFWLFGLSSISVWIFLFLLLPSRDLFLLCKRNWKQIFVTCLIRSNHIPPPLQTPPFNIRYQIRGPF